MKHLNLGVKNKPTNGNPEGSVSVEHHPEMSFMAPHGLKLPSGKFKFGGHAEVVAHDSREGHGAMPGHTMHTLKIHTLDVPHEGPDEDGDVQGGSTAVASSVMDLMDKSARGKDGQNV